jgi:hypothetical protein
MAEPRSIEQRYLRASCCRPLRSQLARETQAAPRGAQKRQGGRFDPTQSAITGSINQEDKQACSRDDSKQDGKNHESRDHLLHVIELKRGDRCQTNPHPLPSLILWNRPRGEHWESFRA